MIDKNIYEIAVFGGGCFWCTEAVFSYLGGVVTVLPGYSGGKLPSPTYEQVSAGDTGHVECTKVEFDPVVISYDQLLKAFFETHDPTTLNKQGNDVGTQYRSVIFYTNEKQKSLAQDFINKIKKAGIYDDPIVTTVEPLKEFYPAEDYHQKYYENHKDAPYCQLVIAPKLDKLDKLQR